MNENREKVKRIETRALQNEKAERRGIRKKKKNNEKKPMMMKGNS